MILLRSIQWEKRDMIRRVRGRPLCAAAARLSPRMVNACAAPRRPAGSYLVSPLVITQFTIILGLFTLTNHLFVKACFAQTQTLQEANHLYQQGQYAQAAENYQTLLSREPENAYLHYNLGNALFKQGSADTLGRAIAQYWRAYQLNPRDSDIRYNLDFALKKTGESLVPPGMPRALHILFYLLSDRELSGLGWLGYWLLLFIGLAVLLGRILQRENEVSPFARYRTRYARPALTGLAAVWLVTTSWWGLRAMNDISNPGVVLQPNTEARSGPGLNFPVSFNAPEGRRVSILSDQGKWLEVGVLKEGLRGWVQANRVEKI